MIAEIGHYALWLALALAVVQFCGGLWGAHRQDGRLMQVAHRATLLQAAMMVVAFGCLAWSFVHFDFSLKNVASNSNRLLPLPYRIAATWGSHEGSMLLWALMLGLWTAAVASFGRTLGTLVRSRVLGVQGFVSIGFLLFLLTTSNPFERSLPAPPDGRDLNPLLQDPGMVLHPPLLYLGYVGFSVAFAFAIAAMLGGRVDAAWTRWARPWTTAAWCFLTLGITLGSWWAYYELGWGGWWFWDPVENASLMPWLAGTALIHSLAVTEKRSTFKAWTVLLAILAFSLCLLGTFLVRSGILVSVHAFASDPTRGLYILVYLVFVIGGSLLLYAFQGAKIKSLDNYQRYSRETLLLLNNVMLMAFLSVVFLGTILPLIHKQIGLGSVSIGAPFFNQMFLILMVPFAFILGIGPLVKWRRDEISAIRTPVMISLVMMIALGFGLPYLVGDRITATSVMGVMMSAIIVILSLYEMHTRATHRHSFLTGMFKLSRSHWGMVLAHLGVAMTVFGIAMSHNFSIEKDVRMREGDSVQILDYNFTFKGLKITDGANYQGGTADIEITRNGKPEATLHAEKRFYNVSKMGMTEAAIDWGFTRDLYAALGEQLDDGSWGLRLYYKPFIRWIWLGGLFMALGGLLCMLDKRYRIRVRE